MVNVSSVSMIFLYFCTYFSQHKIALGNRYSLPISSALESVSDHTVTKAVVSVYGYRQEQYYPKVNFTHFCTMVVYYVRWFNGNTIISVLYVITLYHFRVTSSKTVIPLATLGTTHICQVQSYLARSIHLLDT